jgi:hypothetical protein
LKHSHYLERESNVAVRETATISALINDLDRVVRILDQDIATEEERGGVFNPTKPDYPALARTLATRQNNLKDTMVTLEKRLVELVNRAEQSVPARQIIRSKSTILKAEFEGAS